MNVDRPAKYSWFVTVTVFFASLLPTTGFVLAFSEPFERSECLFIVAVVGFAVLVGAFLAWLSPRDDIRAGILGCLSPVIACILILSLGAAYAVLIRDASLGMALRGAVLYFIGVMICCIAAVGGFRLFYHAASRTHNNNVQGTK
jgi:hypothetical protein